MRVKAYAKINLNLLILNKREDNKHNIESIFHKIDLYDTLVVNKNNSNDCIISCNVKELEDDNLILDAFNILKEEFNIGGVDVELEKRIPMQAGLGGGSSDCAAFIKTINKMYKLNLDYDRLNELFFSLGADIIPCYYDYPLYATGVGNIIKKINSNLEFNIVLIKPEFNCNTGEMYRKLDELGIRHDINDQTTINIIKALENNDLDLLCDNLYNDFEKAVDIKNIKNEFNAKNVLLSGSGSSIFGIYDNYEDSLEDYKVLKKKYNAYLCKSINKE